MRALGERHLVDTDRGHIVVGWLVMQDLLMVIVLVLLPPIAAAFGQQGGAGAGAIDYGSLAASLGLTFAKVAGFIGLMLLVGRRAIPMLLHYIAHTGSRELFRLAVLSVALGVAFAAAELFDVSFALGAFIAGMTLSESELSQVAAEESLPLRDAFAVLFFVSVGMLFDPTILVSDPLEIGGVLLLVVVANPALAFLASRLFGARFDAALLLAAGTAQIGEFSFILADLGIGLGVLSDEARHLILAGSILSILVNPLIFALPTWLLPRLRRPAPAVTVETREERPLVPTRLTDHAVRFSSSRMPRTRSSARRRHRARQSRAMPRMIGSSPRPISGMPECSWWRSRTRLRRGRSSSRRAPPIRASKSSRARISTPRSSICCSTAPTLSSWASARSPARCWSVRHGRCARSPDARRLRCLRLARRSAIVAALVVGNSGSPYARFDPRGSGNHASSVCGAGGERAERA